VMEGSKKVHLVASDQYEAIDPAKITSAVEYALGHRGMHPLSKTWTLHFTSKSLFPWENQPGNGARRAGQAV